jgi:radical SAM superfamily enzyme YgiQ (UPF0313 family)
MKAGPNNFIGIQTGLETGSPKVFEQWMPRKGKPFSAGEWPDAIFEGTCVFNENYWYPVYTMITGLPGETEDDVQESIDLLMRLEHEVPKRVGKERHHYFIGIFPFVNWGIFRNKEKFDLNSMMTPKRAKLFELAYRHMIKELSYPPRGLLKGAGMRLFYNHFGSLTHRFMSHCVDGIMKTMTPSLVHDETKKLAIAVEV